MKTILYANTIDYDFQLRQRPHHIMDILASRGWKVYWVNTKCKNREGVVRERINDNLTVYNSWEVFKRRNPKIDVYFSSWSHRHVDLDQIDYKLCVYDSLDNFEENSDEEHNMIKKADILLTTSQPLYDLRKNEHDNIHMCRNACFPELGQKDYALPFDLRDIPKPYVLFSGALANWCDLDLIETVAAKYNLVFVGTRWGVKTIPKNLICLGNKSYEDLQAYYSYCAVNILPFKRCQTSDYSNPIKNYEAMSHGKITVATDIPEATIYPEAVLASKNTDEFMKNLKKAMKLRNTVDVEYNCFKLAEQNSWYKRVDVIENAIEDYCKKNSIILG